ncbi:MAG: type II toxin-antitoxin system RelE/ParE family toxin, partial [Nevskiales bacterium]
ADIRAETAYYRKINPDLAQRFRMAVESAAYAIPQYPMAMQILDFNVRRWPVDHGFPHGILYRVEEEEILVLSIFHPKRNPDNWKLGARA